MAESTQLPESGGKVSRHPSRKVDPSKMSTSCHARPLQRREHGGWGVFMEPGATTKPDTSLLDF